MATIEDDYAVIMSMTLRELQKYLIMFTLLEGNVICGEPYNSVYDAICERFAHFAKETTMEHYIEYIDDNEYINKFYEAFFVKFRKFFASYLPTDYSLLGGHNISSVHINPQISQFYTYDEICSTFNYVNDHHLQYMRDTFSKKFIDDLIVCGTDFSFSKYGNICTDKIIQLHNLPYHFDRPYCSYDESGLTLIIFLPNFNEAMMDE